MRHYGTPDADMNILSRDNRVDDVLDVTNRSVRRDLGVRQGELSGDSYEATHIVGEWARSHG